MTRKSPLRTALAAALLVAACGTASLAQRKGDYLTQEELDVVRDVQPIDKRAEVFLKVGDRRLEALADPAAEPDGKLSKHMGPLQKGTPVELLDDYRRTVEELMEKLEDEFERKGLSAELQKALKLAVSETERQIRQIEALKPRLAGADAAQFALKATTAARELRDGAQAALSSAGK